MAALAHLCTAGAPETQGPVQACLLALPLGVVSLGLCCSNPSDPGEVRGLAPGSPSAEGK